MVTFHFWPEWFTKRFKIIKTVKSAEVCTKSSWFPVDRINCGFEQPSRLPDFPAKSTSLQVWWSPDIWRNAATCKLDQQSERNEYELVSSEIQLSVTMLFSCTNSAGQRQKGFLALLILNVAAFSRTTLVSADSRSLHAARLQKNRGHKLQHFIIWNLQKPNQTSNESQSDDNERSWRKKNSLSVCFSHNVLLASG